VPTRADRHVGAILLAQQCAELGARCRTIHLITGLKPRELQWLFFSDPQATPRGRAPDSPEWYHSANLLHRAEASIFSSVYQRLRSGRSTRQRVPQLPVDLPVSLPHQL
jgi:hypothetical protein